MRNAVRVVLIAVVAFALLLGAGFVWFQRQLNPPGAPGALVDFTIPEGSSNATIGSILHDKGVITNRRVFRIYLKLHPGELQAGNYSIRARSSINDVVDELEAGPKHTFHRLTIPEGYTLKQIAAKVGQLPGKSADKFLAAAASDTIRSRFEPPSVHNLEGLVFPDTYFVEDKDTEADILGRMVSTFDDVATEENLAAGAVGHDAYQTLTIASLVESEGKVAADRPKIARVIDNRLSMGMLLQVDATVIYARGGRRPNGQVLYSDLKINSPYNTYLVKGLPPTPISAPGRAAIRAALHPADGPWLYYVKFQADGTHKFSVTLAEQNAAIADAKRRGINP
ncbi:MAG TPA: endolytic transglycosylase MltG [Acidimicrobiales bacterium]|nr:endolytic transglycosylase MltG [Acidimicrobiales bacterium]